MDSCFTNKLNKLHISTSQHEHEIKKIDQIDKKIIHNQKNTIIIIQYPE